MKRPPSTSSSVWRCTRRIYQSHIELCVTRIEEVKYARRYYQTPTQLPLQRIRTIQALKLTLPWKLRRYRQVSEDNFIIRDHGEAIKSFLSLKWPFLWSEFISPLSKRQRCKAERPTRSSS